MVIEENYSYQDFFRNVNTLFSPKVIAFSRDSSKLKNLLLIFFEDVVLQLGIYVLRIKTKL